MQIEDTETGTQLLIGPEGEAKTSASLTVGAFCGKCGIVAGAIGRSGSQAVCVQPQSSRYQAMNSMVAIRFPQLLDRYARCSAR